MKENVFGKMAKKYDTAERMELAHIILEQIRPEFDYTKANSLLDYGSGTGLISLELADLVQSLLLVDSSEEMLKIAKAKISSKNIANAKVLHADFTQEIPDIQVDIILVSLVLIHVPDTSKLLNNLYRTLNEGGKLIIVDFDKNNQVNHPKIHNGFTHEEMKETLTQSGFKSINTKTFHYGEKIFAKQDASMFMSTSRK